MDRRFEIKRIVDIAMTVLLLCLMAYQVTGEMAHEWIGMGMTVLIIIHQILNRKWYGALFKGKYRPYRILSTTLNLRHVYERLRCTLPLWNGSGFFRAQNTPFNVALELCSDGDASWNAHSYDDSRPEMEGQNKNHPCRSLHLYWRDRTVSVSSERNAGLSVLPGPVRIPRL